MDSLSPVAGYAPNGTVLYASSPNLVKFYLDARYMAALSEKEGRPIHEEVEMVEIIKPGGRDIVVREATDRDRQNYHREYQAFKAGNAETFVNGTPVKEWPQVSVSMVATLHHLKIYSVEQLAALSDGDLQFLGMGGRELRTKAQAFLKAAKEQGAFQSMAVENEKLKSQLAEQSDLISKLSTRLEQLEAKGKKKQVESE